MKKLLIIFLLASYFTSVSQINDNKPKTQPAAVKKKGSGAVDKNKYGTATTQSSSGPLDNLMHNTCINKQFSIVFYIVLDSLKPTDPGYPGLNMLVPADLTSLINNLNRAFDPICVSFANCSTVIVPNYTYGKSWIKPTTEPSITSTYYTEKTINFYLVDTIYKPSIQPERGGYTYMPTPANLASPKKDFLVMEKAHLTSSDTTALHLMGHYFGLPHTFDEINPGGSPPAPSPLATQELANGSNCYIHGDGFCDTDADPWNLPGMNVLKDAMNNFYVRPIDNYMSFYVARLRYTQEQYNHMTYHILNTRNYLH